MMAAHAVPAARKRTAASVLTLTLVVLSLVASSASPARAAAPDTTRLTVGAEERVRTENWDNVVDFNSAEVKGDTRHQLRLRTRAWARLGFGRDEVAVGLLNESRRLSTPKVKLQMDEVVFETLYWEHRFAQGASLRVGRQNLARGDGFLLFDGSPLDGSRSAYVNAVDLAWTRGRSRLDVLLLSNPWREEYLPVVHDRNRPLIERDERLAGLYWSGPGPEPGCTLDFYYLYKTETTNSARLTDRFVHTGGLRWARDFGGGWSARLEGAGQLGGQQPSMGIAAWGGHCGVTRAFDVPMKPSLTLGAVALSGDDPATTSRNEAWDPLLSRYPRWAEGYIYTLATETGAAYWSNLSLLQVEGRLTPMKQVEAKASWQRLGALRHFAGRPSIYGDGLVRGDLYSGRVDVRLGDSWRGHVVAERYRPGSFYRHDDGAWFFRVEGVYTFQRLFAFAGQAAPSAARPVAAK